MEASEICYKGGLVGIDGTDGLAQAAAHGVAMEVVGIADAQADNSSGADSAIQVPVISDVVVLLTQDGNITKAMEGGLCYALDDATITDALTATQDNTVGRIVQRLSATQCWVYIPAGGGAGLS